LPLAVLLASPFPLALLLALALWRHTLRRIDKMQQSLLQYPPVEPLPLQPGHAFEKLQGGLQWIK
jgi:hypothetical protein